MPDLDWLVNAADGKRRLLSDLAFVMRNFKRCQDASTGALDLDRSPSYPFEGLEGLLATKVAAGSFMWSYLRSLSRPLVQTRNQGSAVRRLNNRKEEA